MAQIILEIPDDVCNQLNNYYFSNFKYEIHTQLQNFIYHEWMKCEDYPTSRIEPQPVPSIFGIGSSVATRITFPNGTNYIKECSNYKQCINTMNDLSKTEYKIDRQSKQQPTPKKMEYIHNVHGRGYIIVRSKKQYGTFKVEEDAIIVRDFLQEHEWDEKYQAKNLVGKFDCTGRNSSDVLLQIAKGEIEYED